MITLPMGEVPEVPDQFRCPICGEKLTLEIDEWTSDYDGWKASDSGVHVTCITEAAVEGTDEWGSWMDGHYKYPYIDWLPVDRKIYAWLEDNYRFTPREDLMRGQEKANKMQVLGIDITPEQANGITKAFVEEYMGHPLLHPNSYILDRFEWSIHITLELVFQMDGSEKWAIREKGCCLNKEGEWEIEPIPSSRDDEFLRRCRFDNLQEAVEFWNKGHKSRFEHYRTRKGSQK